MAATSRTPPAAPIQGAAPTVAEQARALADRLHAQQQAAAAAPRPRYPTAAPLTREEAQWEPQNDPCRWQGFL